MIEIRQSYQKFWWLEHWAIVLGKIFLFFENCFVLQVYLTAWVTAPLNLSKWHAIIKQGLNVSVRIQFLKYQDGGVCRVWTLAAACDRVCWWMCTFPTKSKSVKWLLSGRTQRQKLKRSTVARCLRWHNFTSHETLHPHTRPFLYRARMWSRDRSFYGRIFNDCVGCVMVIRSLWIKINRNMNVWRVV